jgi:hypothetical protein
MYRTGAVGAMEKLTTWRSRTMLSRYGASVADERARNEAHRLALGDRLQRTGTKRLRSWTSWLLLYSSTSA